MQFSRASLFFYLVLPLLVSLAVFTTHFQTNISAFVVAGDNAEEILLASEIQSGTLSRRYILSIDAGEHQLTKQFVNDFLGKLKAITGVVDVWSANEQKETMVLLSKLYTPYGAQLYSRTPEKSLSALLTASALSARAEALREALLSPQGALIKKIAIQDPLLLSLNGFKALGTQLKKNLQTSRYSNFILETGVSGMDVSAQLAIQASITAVFDAENIEKLYQLEMTGIPLFAAKTQSMMETDIKFVSILSSVALSVLFLLIFRSFRVLFWVFSLLITVMTVAVLVTNAVFGSVHGMTMAIGSTLIGICIDYPIHVLVHGQGLEAGARLKSIKTIFPSILMGALTTLIGYIALGLSGYPGFQQVAVYTVTGIVTSLVLTRYLFPHLMTVDAKIVKPFVFIRFWSVFCQTYHRFLMVGVILLLIVSVFQLKNLQWMHDLQQLTPELNALKAHDKKIRERLITMEPGRFILVGGESIENTLQRAEKVYLRLDELKKSGALEDYFGVYPWLLSQQQQLKNQQLLTAALTDTTLTFWQAALLKQGLSVRRLGNLDYSHTHTLAVEQVLKSSIAKLISQQLIIKEQKILLIIWLTAHQPEILQASLKDLPQVHYFSQRDMLNRMAINYQKNAEITLFFGLMLISLLLWLRYRSILTTLQTLAPAFLAALLILALWAWTGEVISFLHLVGFLLAVAICVDYGIFYQENRGGHLLLTYQAMAASVLTSSLVFGCLIFAETAMLQTLAKVVSSGILLGFLLCPILIRPKKNEYKD